MFREECVEEEKRIKEEGRGRQGKGEDRMTVAGIIKDRGRRRECIGWNAIQRRGE